MFRLFFAILLLANSTAQASETYTVDGEVRSFFFHYFVFVCSFKNVDAMSIGKDGPKPIPSYFSTVTNYKVMQDGEASCSITTKTDEKLIFDPRALAHC